MQRRAIRSRTENWSRNQLPQICRAAVDVAACEIRIRFLEIRRGHFVTRKNAIAKSGSEARELPHCRVEKSRPRFWKLIEIFDATLDVDLPAQIAKVISQRV